jgi:hypothetical protein
MRVGSDSLLRLCVGTSGGRQELLLLPAKASPEPSVPVVSSCAGALLSNFTAVLRNK